MLKLFNNKSISIVIIYTLLYIFSISSQDSITTSNCTSQNQSKTSKILPSKTIPKYPYQIEGFSATELGKACFENDTLKIQKLIKNGASIENCLADEIYTFDILYTSLILNKIKLVKYVLSNKMYTSINEVYTEDSETPLTLACSIENPDDAFEIAKIFISMGANVNGAGDSGGDYTKYPIIIAVSNNNISLVKLLLQKGASKNVRKYETDETLLEIAENNGFNSITEILKKE